MNNHEHLNTVKRLYAAFGAGDLPGLLAVIDAWSGEGHGHEHVERFFQKLGTTAALKTFEPRSFVSEGDEVVVMGYEEGTARATGRDWKTHFTHQFTVKDGKVTSHREYVDTQAIADAFRG